MTPAPHDPWLQPRLPDARPLVVVGCMNFGSRTNEAESQAIIERALHHGLTCFDTANAYSDGNSERIVGRVLNGVKEARIATKVGIGKLNGPPEGLAPRIVASAFDACLERLGRDSVDLLYLHTPDHRTPIDATLGALAPLLERGKSKHFAASNYAAWELLELMLRCDARGMPRPVASQVMLNAAIRQVEVEYVPFAKKYGLHTTVYNPLAGGLLARDVPADGVPPKGSRFDKLRRYRDRYWSPRLLAFAAQLRDLADSAGLTLLELAYGWLVLHPGVDSILVGPASVAHLDDAVTACARDLEPSLLKKLAALQRDFDGTDAKYAR